MNTRTLYMRKPISQILDKIWEYPLTVVEAPMGYGKTTAVREYLKSRKTEILWQTVIDNSPNDFWRGFSRLFAKLDTEAAAKLNRLGVPQNSSFILEAVEMIGHIKFGRKAVIVLDDYHFLTSAPIDRFIEVLIKNLPDNLHVVIISRVLFGENTTELALKGYCHVIDKSFFEFTKEEIIAYYKMCGISLSQEEAVKLHDYTEGWISALYLCMLDFLQEGHIEQQASLYELLEKVVYRNFPEEVKDFLLHICIFENFTLAQAKFLWPKGNGEDILKYLMAKNAFLKYNSLNQTYQLHNIFTSYLRQVLDRREKEIKQVLFRTAGEWYVSIEEYMHALEYFYRIGDFDRLLTAVELNKRIGLSNENKAAIIQYFTECPVEIKQRHPIACLLYGVNLFVVHETELLGELCQKMREYIETAPQLDAKTRNWLTGELEMLYGYTEYNDLAAMASHHPKARTLLAGCSKFVDNQFSWTFGSPSILYLYYRESGKLKKTVQDFFACMPCYFEVTQGHGFGVEYMMQAESYYYCGDFKNAEISAQKALYRAQSHQQFAILFCVQFLQIKLALLKGDLQYVVNALRQMHEDIRKTGMREYFCTRDFCEGFVYAYLNQAQKIPACILAGEVEETCLYFFNHTYFNILYGKSLLISGKYLKVIAIAEHFISVANVFPNLLGHIYTYIYVAAAHYKLNDYQEAKAALRHALHIAMPDGLLMPFVENGKEILQILHELGKDKQYADFAAQVTKIYLPVGENLMAMQDKLENKESDALTARETEIAALVVKGLSNRIIAETLGIAEITVKKILHNIYGKLQVNNRTALTRLLTEKQIS